jgi:hypothetical protein
MPLIITSIVTSTALQDASPSGTSGVTVTKRLVSNQVLSLLSSTDVAALKTVAFGDVLDGFAGYDDSVELGRLRLRSTQLVAVPGSEGFVFDAIGRFDTLYVWCDVPTLGGALHLPVETDVDATPRSVVAYRSSPTTSPSANLNTTTDIGGGKLDYGGKPVQTTVWQQTLRLSLIIDSSRFTLTSIFDRVASHQGCWNSASFLHWDPNTVFCESAAISHIRDEYYRATYLFRSDYWNGCDQQPKIDVWGKSEIGADGASSNVTWKSIVYGTIDHNLIFNDQPNATVAKQWAKEGSFLTYP